MGKAPDIMRDERQADGGRRVSDPTDTEILDWLEEHGISVRIQANDRQSFFVPTTRAAIRFEMTAGNVDSPNVKDEPRP